MTSPTPETAIWFIFPSGRPPLKPLDWPGKILLTATVATNATIMREPDKTLDNIAARILDGAFVVHKELGPGLLEGIYEACLCDILMEYGLEVERQKAMPVFFRNKILDTGYRTDLIVERSVLVEIKSLDKLHPIHEAQIMTYMKLSKLELGLLLNFNVPLMKQGIKRFYINQNRGDLGVVAV